MLNIPTSIQNLFKTDGVFKNFRVHFPNGEHSDLTNSDIVAESVKFTESICSKEVFQFGLSERPTIEFECVNVPNIYGVSIECGIEIDTSSLTAQQIADIQSGTYDGTLVLEADSDIGFGYYRIPYGSFIVQSCPRSHGAMYRRRITAYGKAPQDITLSSFLSKKYTMQYNLPETINQNPFAIIADTQNSIDWLTTTETTLTANSQASQSGLRVYLDNGGYLEFAFTYKYTKTHQYDPDVLFRITAEIDDTFRDTIVNYLDARDIHIDTEKIYGDTQTSGETFDHFFRPFVLYKFSDGAGWGYDRFVMPGTPNESGYFYPYMPLDTSTGEMYICYPFSIGSVEQYTSSGGFVHSFGSASGMVTNPVIKSYTISDTSIAKSSIGIKGTGIGTISGVTVYSYLNSLDLPGLYNGLYELMGCFRKIDRTGQEQTVILSNNNPYAITRDQYSELWWDDFTVDNIGTILLTYKDTDEGKNQTIQYRIGDGASVYDMTNNYMLNNLTVTAADLGETIEAYVLGMIDSFFVPNIGAVTFLPYEMTALNIPYFEPGDYIEIDNGDSGTVETFILARNIDGIQTLYDSVEANSGKLDGEG